MQPSLLSDLPPASPPVPAAPTTPEVARLLRPVRNQVQWMERDLDSLLPEDHQARAIWAFLDRLDLSAFYRSIKAVLDRPGHPAIDPQVLLALWVYATKEGVGSARQLDRLCREHDGYRWLCGGVTVNYHTLSDFRVAYQEGLDDLLTKILAAMMSQGLVILAGVAQDGTRVRASAGAGSFRRKERLEQYLAAAQEQVQRLAQEREQPDPEGSRRQQGARERAAQERQQRLEKALEQLPALEAAKDRQRQSLARSRRDRVSEPRVSTTDPEARVMKLADGGFRPAYNLQLATDTASQVIVGVAVTNQGADAGQGGPMEEQVAQRTGRHPAAYLMDGGFVQLQDITTLTERGICVYAPVRAPRSGERQRSDRRWGDSSAVVAWRERMETEQAKAIYKQRAATAECVNAQVLDRYGLRQFNVRGLEKVLTVGLLLAVTHNVLRWLALT